MTNFEHIKNMDKEELANFLEGIDKLGICTCNGFIPDCEDCECYVDGKCYECIQDWLDQKAEE